MINKCPKGLESHIFHGAPKKKAMPPTAPLTPKSESHGAAPASADTSSVPSHDGAASHAAPSMDPIPPEDGMDPKKRAFWESLDPAVGNCMGMMILVVIVMREA